MVDEGGLLDSLPNSPLPTSILDDLEEHDGIRLAMPMMARFGGEEEVADRIILQTDSVAVVAGHDPAADGWVVEHRVEGDDPDSMIEEAMFRAQAEQEMLVEEMEEMADED